MLLFMSRIGIPEQRHTHDIVSMFCCMLERLGDQPQQRNIAPEWRRARFMPQLLVKVWKQFELRGANPAEFSEHGLQILALAPCTILVEIGLIDSDRLAQPYLHARYDSVLLVVQR